MFKALSALRDPRTTPGASSCLESARRGHDGRPRSWGEAEADRGAQAAERDDERARRVQEETRRIVRDALMAELPVGFDSEVQNLEAGMTSFWPPSGIWSGLMPP